MSKTLHQKLTSKAALLQPSYSTEGLLSVHRFEHNLMEGLASELLQPRAQAITALLEMAATIPFTKKA
jgi:hypothetical protein